MGAVPVGYSLTLKKSFCIHRNLQS